MLMLNNRKDYEEYDIDEDDQDDEDDDDDDCNADVEKLLLMMRIMTAIREIWMVLMMRMMV